MELGWASLKAFLAAARAGQGTLSMSAAANIGTTFLVMFNRDSAVAK
jgi:hypothetical protein